MNKIKDYNVVYINPNDRCDLLCIKRTGSIVSVFLGKADFLCADPRIRARLIENVTGVYKDQYIFSFVHVLRFKLLSLSPS